MNKSQSLEEKLAEVTFRDKLVKQHLGKKTYFKGQPDKDVILQELKTRVEATKNDFNILIQKKITISPFLEIGAEKGQRAMYLVNKLDASGFAADISFESLKSAGDLLEPLEYNKLPIRICVDAYHLPFKDNSLPLVFFYETLHHFPNPKPVLDEAFRVLRSDGHLFFSEEPVKQITNLRLWRRDYNLRTLEKVLKYTLILPFLSTIGKSEVEHGVLEKTFWLDIWEKSLDRYDKVEVEVKPIFFGKSQRIKKNNKKRGWLKPDVPRKILLATQGGGITALASVNKDLKKDVFSKNIFDLLSCPTCPHKTSLIFNKNKASCKICKDTYKIKNGIFVLLPKKIERELYG